MQACDVDLQANWQMCNGYKGNRLVQQRAMVPLQKEASTWGGNVATSSLKTPHMPGGQPS
jgi:hypothetical protein